MTADELKEGYFELIKESAALRTDAGPFDGQPWGVMRERDGRQMTVYEIEGEIEVCIVFDDGTSRTYS